MVTNDWCISHLIYLTELNFYIAELNNAAASFATNEDMQMYWITVEEDLRLIIESGCVQETDPYSGGENKTITIRKT